MKKYLIVLTSFVLSQVPVSDPGSDQAVSAGSQVTLSGANSSGHQTYSWTVPEGVEVSGSTVSETLTFTAPNLVATDIFTFTLEVGDGAGGTSQEFDCSDLIISEYCEQTGSNKYLEIYNGTGATITSEDWPKYEIWLARNSGDFSQGEDLWAKLLFYRFVEDSDYDTHDINTTEGISVIFPDSLKDGQSLVIVRSLSGADPLITGSDFVYEWSSLNKMNGNDGVALIKNGAPIDVIGSAEENGDWEVAGVNNATDGYTLVRKSTVVSGATEWDLAGNANAENSEWIVVDESANSATFDYVGVHNCTSCDNKVNVIVGISPAANAGDDFSTCQETVLLGGSVSEEGTEYKYQWSIDTNISQSWYHDSCDTYTNTYTCLSNGEQFAGLSACNSSCQASFEENCVQDTDCDDQLFCSYDMPAGLGVGSCEQCSDLDEDDCGDNLYCIWNDNQCNDDYSKLLDNSDTATPTFTSPSNLLSNTPITFNLSVQDLYSDDLYLEASDNVDVTILADLCPVAVATNKRYRINTVESITLDGTASYDPGEPNASLDYIWTPINDLGDIQISQEGANYILSNLPQQLTENPMEFKFELVVEDETGNQSTPEVVSVFIADFGAPDQPTIYAVPYSDYIKLSWDFVSEDSKDPLTTYADFEGYKLYRSTDGGETWCEPEDRVFDFDGNEAGCKPYAQFDLTESQDLDHCVYKEGYSGCEHKRNENISEYDPAEGWSYLGSNSGLEHVFIDEDVINGMDYTYTLTAYDMGVRTYSIDYIQIEDAFDDYGNPLFQQTTNWSSSNPDQWTLEGQGYVSTDIDEDNAVVSIESNLGTIGDSNFIQVIPGGLPVNITDPSPNLSESYIKADSNNVGNSDRYFDIVFKQDVIDTYLKFEIQAEYGLNETGNLINSFESNKCENPTLYAWEVDELGNPKDPIYLDVINLSFTTTLNQELDLPGVELEEIDGVSTLVYPDYLVEGMDVLFADELGADENWTPLIYGVRFRFDNGFGSYSSTAYEAKYAAKNSPNLIDAYTAPDSMLYEAFSDQPSRDFEIYYAGSDGQPFNMRPPYKYVIEFSDEPEYPVWAGDGTAAGKGCFVSSGLQGLDGECPCTEAEGLPKLPFRVKNLVTNKYTQLVLYDYGTDGGQSLDGNSIVSNAVDLDGRCDCSWTRSETIGIKDTVTTTFTPVPHLIDGSFVGESNFIYDLNLDFFDYREIVGNVPVWNENREYSSGDRVEYQSMIWRAVDNVPEALPPPSGNDASYTTQTNTNFKGRKGWYDCGEDLLCNQNEAGYNSISNPDPQGDDYPNGTEGDGVNDNPWKHSYFWDKGDKLYFTPSAWYTDGDSWTVDLGEISKTEVVNQNSVEGVTVVPNPYRASSIFNQNTLFEEETIYFDKLPSPCTITIYTVTGKIVDKLYYAFDGERPGRKEWHLKNKNGEKIAPGLYLFSVESQGKSHVGKFAIVR